MNLPLLLAATTGSDRLRPGGTEVERAFAGSERPGNGELTTVEWCAVCARVAEASYHEADDIKMSIMCTPKACK